MISQLESEKIRPFLIWVGCVCVSLQAALRSPTLQLKCIGVHVIVSLSLLPFCLSANPSPSYPPPTPSAHVLGIVQHQRSPLAAQKEEGLSLWSARPIKVAFLGVGGVRR